MIVKYKVKHKLNKGMKNICLLLVILNLVHTDSTSQSVSIANLVSKSSCKAFSCYDSFMKENNWILSESLNESNYKSFRYESKEYMIPTSNSKTNTKNQSIFIVSSDGSVMTGYTTYNVNEYKNLYIELTSLNFKSIRTYTEDNPFDINDMILEDFVSNKYPKVTLTINKSTIYKSPFGRWNCYIFTVLREP